MNLGQLIYEAAQRGDFDTTVNNPLAQFGTPDRQYLGARFLPEQPRRRNSYVERNVRFRTIIANSGARYAPSQVKKGARTGAMEVRTGNSDIKSTLDGEEYDALLDMLDSNADMQAMAQITNFVDTSITRALVELVEAQRWRAIVDAKVVRKGDNGYTEDVNYPTFAGLRATSAGDWADNTYDPMPDIMTIARAMAARGRRVTALVSSTEDVMVLMGNAKMQARLGYLVVNATGQIAGQPGFVTREALDRYFVAQGLPPITTYDLTYNTNTGVGYFLPRRALVFFSQTGRDENIDLGNGDIEVVQNTLGYVAIGRPTGRGTPGRVVRVEYKDDKPPRVVTEGWQETMTVLTEPDAIGVLKR